MLQGTAPGWPAEAEAALRATGGKSPQRNGKNNGKNDGKTHGFYGKSWENPMVSINIHSFY